MHARSSDKPAILRLLENAHCESPRLNREPFSAYQAGKTIDNIIAHSPVETLGLVCYLNGEAIACMGAMMCPQLTADSLLATELLLYVLPEHRGSWAAYHMVKAFEQWAGPYDKRAGSSLNIDDEAAVDFYKRLGYEECAIGVMKRGSNDG